MPTPRKPRAKGGYPDTSPEDIAALEEFLRREPWGKRTMSISMLDGFLTAIVIGPEVVMPSDYLPWIWDWKRGKKDVEFEDLNEANRIFGYVQGMHNRVAGPLMAEPPATLPLFLLEPHRDHGEWLAGFDMGRSSTSMSGTMRTRALQSFSNRSRSWTAWSTTIPAGWRLLPT